MITPHNIRRPTWSLILLATLFGGVLFIGATRVRPPTGGAPAPAPASAAPAPVVGHPAPAFTLRTPEGAAVALGDLRGQVVLVNFWATWCPPCRTEMPAIQAAYARYQGQGFTVLAVTAGEEPDSVAAFLRDYDLRFPALLDDGQVSAAYAASALPSSFFVDRRGVVRAIYKGPIAYGAIAGTVEQLLAEP